MPLFAEFEQLGGGIRDVDEAVAMIRPAVVDANDDATLPLARLVTRAYRQSAWSDGLRSARSCRTPRHWRSDVRGSRRRTMSAMSLGAVVGVFFGNVGPPGDGVRLADAIGAAALRNGLAERHHARTGRDAVFGIDAAGEFVRRGAIRDKAGIPRHAVTARATPLPDPLALFPSEHQYHPKEAHSPTAWLWLKRSSSYR